MLPKLNAALAAAAIASASAVVGPGGGDAFAGDINKRHVIVTHLRPSACAPYYYSHWNPYSIYSIYDHLSGGRHLCDLPSECCDNNHRVTN